VVILQAILGKEMIFEQNKSVSVTDFTTMKSKLHPFLHSVLIREG
jgi:hypothetical protein